MERAPPSSPPRGLYLALAGLPAVTAAALLITLAWSKEYRHTDVSINEDNSNIIPISRSLAAVSMIQEDVGFPDLFPLEWPDYLGFAGTVIGLMMAAGGGIGGGGILVPIYILLFEFPVKHAIPLASVTVLGGAVANNLLNYSKRDPRHPERSCIDWDLILQLEPMTMAGALMGAALNDLLPELVLVIFLLVLLSLTAYKTLLKAHSMYVKEDQAALSQERQTLVMKPSNAPGGGIPYGTLDTVASDDVSDTQHLPLDKASSDERDNTARWVTISSILKLTGLFVIITGMNLLKGGTSEGGGPVGLSHCGTSCFWITNGAMILVILVFAVWVRRGILDRVSQGGPILSDIAWNERNTIFYPLLAIVAGLAAGMFGIGGGIVKGPLMLALGVHASVASATSACMILFTSSTATASYMVFGLVLYDYALAGLVVGFVATLVGQTIMTALLAKYNRHSYIAYSIGLVVAVSAVAMGIESILALIQQE